MFPSMSPNVIIAENVVHPAWCREVIRTMSQLETYSMGGCHATTREAPHPLNQIFDVVVGHTLRQNSYYWGFDLHDSPMAWMQEYRKGDRYQQHFDIGPGVSRKLTSIVFLTSRDEYTGG